MIDDRKNPTPNSELPDWVTQDFSGPELSGPGLNLEKKIAEIGRYFDHLTRNILGGEILPRVARIGDIWNSGLQTMVEVKATRHLGSWQISLSQMRRYRSFLRDSNKFALAAKKSGVEKIPQPKNYLFFLYDYETPGSNHSHLNNANVDEIPQILHRTPKRLFILDLETIEKFSRLPGAIRQKKSGKNKPAKQVFVSKVDLAKSAKLICRYQDIENDPNGQRTQRTLSRIEKELEFLESGEGKPRLPHSVFINLIDWDNWPSWLKNMEADWNGEKSNDMADGKETGRKLEIVPIIYSQGFLENVLSMIQQRTVVKETPKSNFIGKRR